MVLTMGRDRERERDRGERDRFHRHRSHSRERDPVRRDRDRERDRERRERRSRSRTRSRSRSPRSHRRSPVYLAGPSGKHEEAPAQALTEEEKQMKELLGFSSFHTTKGRNMFEHWGMTCSDGKRREDLPDIEEYKLWLRKIHRASFEEQTRFHEKEQNLERRQERKPSSYSKEDRVRYSRDTQPSRDSLSHHHRERHRSGDKK